jgi:phospholipid/cholesterol/gamma-HCH transport system substrate-binding protein
MNISKEVRIGILFVLSVLVFFIGFYFLKGASLFSSNKEYYCYYNSVEGLANSANVQIRGLNVGRVTRMDLEGGRVKVELTVDKKVNIPEGTLASISGADLLGSKVIKLDPGPGPAMLPPGATLATASEVGLMDKVSDELTPRLAELKRTIILLDSALMSVNILMGATNQKAIADALVSIKVTSDNLARLSSAFNSTEINGIVHNAHSITTNLAKSNDTIQRILSNVSRISGQLAGAPLQKTMTELQSASVQLHGIADKINNSNGSLGLLINNKDLYNNLNGSVSSLHALMDDIKANPRRYINVSVFGGKGKK